MLIVSFQHDTNHDGHISLRELRVLINAGGCSDIPHHVTIQILKKSDRDNSGHLSFEEFLEMIHRPENQTHFQHLTQKYIKMLVPSRNAHMYRSADTTGINTFHLYLNNKNISY